MHFHPTLGFIFFGLEGAWAWFAAAAFVTANFLFSYLTRPKIPGARHLDDLSITTSTYGESIKKVWGTISIAPNIIFAKRYRRGDGQEGYLREVKKKTTDDMKYYTARCTIALGLCENEIKGILSIKANQKMIYNVRSTATAEERLASRRFAAKFMRVYYGTEDQTVDPTLLDAYDCIFDMNNTKIETGGNAGHYSAHRGFAYIVLKDFELENYGNTIPQFLVEVIAGTADEQKTFTAITPTEAITSAGVWSARYGHSLISSPAGKFYLIGGKDASDYSSEIWSSTDGKYWKKEANIPDDPRVIHYGANGRQTKTITDYGKRAFSGLIWDANEIGIIGGDDNSSSKYKRWITSSGALNMYHRQDQLGVTKTGTGTGPKNITDVDNLESYYQVPLTITQAGCISYSKIDVDDWGNWTEVQKSFICGGYELSGGTKTYHKDLFIMFNGTDPVTQKLFNGFAIGRLTGDCGIGWRHGHYLVHNTSTDVILLVGGVVCADSAGSSPTNSFQVMQLNETTSQFSQICADLTGGATGTKKVVGAVYWGNKYYAFVAGVTGGKLKIYSSSDGVTWAADSILLNGTTELTDYDIAYPPSICVYNDCIFIIGGGRSGVLTNTIYRTEPDTVRDADTADLDDVLTDICTESTLVSGDLDLTDLSDLTVRGFCRYNVESPRQTISDLLAAFYLDQKEANGKITFTQRGGSADFSVSESNMGIKPIGSGIKSKISIIKNDWQDSPKQFDVSYISQEMEYEKSIQHSFDSVTTSKKVESVELPVVLTDDEAKKIAMILRDDYHLSENEISCSLPINYLDCLPGDTFTTTIDNVGYTLRITEKRVSLENRIIELKCTLEDLDIYSKSYTGITRTGFIIPSKWTIPDTLAQILDIPLLKVGDDSVPYGFYMAVCPAIGQESSNVFYQNWSGASIWIKREADTEFSFLQGTEKISAIGTVYGGSGEHGLASGTEGAWDEINYVDVRLVYGQTSALRSYTKQEVYQGKGAYLCGTEIIHARTATQLAADQYRLSGLLRGRRGTEWAIDDHHLGEQFVFLDNVMRIPLKKEDIGQRIYFKIVSSGKSTDDAPVIPFEFQGVSKRPLAPGTFRGIKAENGAWEFTWIRRRRGLSEFITTLEEIGEPIEKYEIDIYNGDEVVHTESIIITALPQNQKNPYYILPVLGSWQLTGYVPGKPIGSSYRYGQKDIFGSEVNQIKVELFQIGEFGRGFGVEKTFTA